MTARDRMVVIVVAAIALLGAVWLLAVSPKRSEASKLAGEVSSAHAALASAESQLADASSAQAHYESAYASIVRLGKAVPASQEVPSLVYQLAQASNSKNVEFASITTGSGSSGSSGSASSSSGSSTGSAATAAASAGFSQMPFTFVFNGTYDDLYHMFQQLNGFTLHTTSGGLQVSGRLLTIQSVKLEPSTTVSSSASSKGGSEQLSGTITATAYVLPAGQSLTGGATASGPAGTTTQTASTGASASSATPPAVAQVKP